MRARRHASGKRWLCCSTGDPEAKHQRAIDFPHGKSTKTILKRVYKQATKADEQFLYPLGKLVCDFANQQILVNDQAITLTNKEAKLLKLFCLHKNKVIDRDSIQKAIWEDEGYFVGRSMDVFISRLRKLLRDDPSINLLNVHGVGYKLEVK
jgi:two-component system, OmpR family, response regulator